MQRQLIVAVAWSLKAKAIALLEDHTVGRWSRNVTFLDLDVGDGASNDSELHQLAGGSVSPIFAAADITSAWLEVSHHHLRRFQSDTLLAEIVRWIDGNGLSWHSILRANLGRGAYKWASVDDWRGQFKRVNPVIGPRVAKALLAQLKIVTEAELTGWLYNQQEFEHNAYFIGSDPHSGDYGLVNLLAGCVDGDKLHDASKLPGLADGASVRLFADGGWSGGESERRLKCLIKQCPNKTSHVGPQHRLFMRFAYLTDIGKDRLQLAVSNLQASGQLVNAEISHPDLNLLSTKCGDVTVGLAFSDPLIQKYVDESNPDAMLKFCLDLGQQISKRRPLGTQKIASTIAFQHSLPKAMLPLFIFGGQDVKANDGSTFKWKALLNSNHVTRPAPSDAHYHCVNCPLADEKKASQQTTTIADQPRPAN